MRPSDIRESVKDIFNIKEWSVCLKRVVCVIEREGGGKGRVEMG